MEDKNRETLSVRDIVARAMSVDSKTKCNIEEATLV